MPSIARWITVWLTSPLFGSRRAQAVRAVWYCEALTPSCCADSFAIAPLPSGSGKLGTPCERMHWENLTADVAAGEPPLSAAGGPPPHPARTRAVVAMRAAPRSPFRRTRCSEKRLCIGPSPQIHGDVAVDPSEALAFTVRGRPLRRPRISFADARSADVEEGSPLRVHGGVGPVPKAVGAHALGIVALDVEDPLDECLGTGSGIEAVLGLLSERPAGVGEHALACRSRRPELGAADPELRSVALRQMSTAVLLALVHTGSTSVLGGSP
jgi:hypothetical protein